MPTGVKSSHSGSALIITLAFMVMLLGVLLAFFSQTTLQQQVSQSSSSQTSGDVLARGVVESIVGDLLQEITAGSTITTNVTGGVTNLLYYPAMNSSNCCPNMVPSLSGFTPTNAFTNTGLENILKVSGTNPFFSVVSSAGSTSNGPIRGSTSASTSLSYNGRSVSTARWNRSLLIGRQTPSSTTDYTPVNAFTNAIPKWILVARNGSNPTTWSNNMIWSATNGNTVIGRYAYIIHNEGGLLDANVAGYPPSLTNSTVTNPAYVPYKVGSFFADLTQIGLSTSQITALVGWRNDASALSSGTFPLYTIPNKGTNYAATMIADTNGALITYQTNSTSDRRFTSRQQLIEFLKAADTTSSNTIASALNALPYLGTFSRSLDQPTYFWDSNRPKIIGLGYAHTNAGSARPLTDFIFGGNDQYGSDNSVNPNFSTNRVATNFTRYDGTTNGTPAVVGEPLVKKRFPLSRLAWLTCKGPSATLYASAPSDPVITQLMSNGVSLQTITNGTTNNIYKSFGLTWTAGPGTGGIGGSWTYSHGITNVIGYLSSVAALTGTKAREPDFFELLKAGLSAGSLAKGGAANSTIYNPYELAGQGVYETTLDNQVIQIGANIISQATVDGFPVCIWFQNQTTQLLNPFWGVNDLPYLQGLVAMTILVNKPTTNSVALTDNTPVTMNTNTITNFVQGLGVLNIVPIIWNPHASPSNFAVLGPTNLRICISSLDLNQPTQSLTNTTAVLGWTPSVNITYNFSNTNSTNSSNTAISTNTYTATNGAFTNPWGVGTINTNQGLYVQMPASGAMSNTAITFNYATNLYREPTLLMQPGIPSGSSLALDSNNVMPSAWINGVPELTSGTNFIGFYGGQFPICWTNTSGTFINSNSAGVFTNSVTNNYFWTAVSVGQLGYNPSYAPTISLEYQPPGSTSWIPYMQYPVNYAFVGPHVAYNAIAGTNAEFTRFVLNTNNWVGETHTDVGWTPVWRWDPRTRRWSAMGAYYGSPIFLSTVSNTVLSHRPGSSPDFVQYGVSLGEASTDCKTGGGYPIEQMGTYAPSSCGKYYFVNANGNIVDADGVTRLGMGASYNSNALTTNGMPLATPVAPSSRPIILHRPFRNVGELGYVFSDTPWRNIDFATPQSGCSALLDLFCIQENGRPDAVVAGKVDLNTRQTPVLAALIAGGRRDEQPSGSDTPLASNEASALAAKLVARTSGTATGLGASGPLRNIGDLVGRWISGAGSSASASGTSPGVPSTTPPVYDGFSADVSPGTNSYYTNIPSNSITMSVTNRVQRFLGAPIRALANTGQVGAWNLLIDVVVQIGKYPASAGNLDQFQVQGETRYWVHLAIDRLTGKVLEKTIERVNE